MKKSKHLDPIIAQAVKASFENGKLLESQALKIVTAFKKQSKNEAIYLISGYLKGLRREMAFHELQIESAVELSASEIIEIKKKITENNDLTTIKTNINPDILGGVRVQVSDMVYDFSLKQRILQVKEAIHG